MFGRIVFSETKRVEQRCEELAGMPIQTVFIPTGGVTRRRIRKAARLFYRGGVRRILVPPGFSDWQQLAYFAIQPVDTVPFIQSLAVPLALSALAFRGISPEQAIVVLAGRRVSKAFRDAAVALCPRIHQLIVSAPAGGAGLADYLRREYGLPLLESCRTPHLVLLFSAMELDGEAPVLHLYQPSPDLPGFHIRPKSIPLPAGCETIPFLAVMWESGRLSARDIEVFPCEDT